MGPETVGELQSVTSCNVQSADSRPIALQLGKARQYIRLRLYVVVSGDADVTDVG